MESWINVCEENLSFRWIHNSIWIVLLKTSSRNLDDGGDKDPTRKIIEKSHIVHIPIKRKREFQKEGYEVPKAKESPKDMEVDDMIEEPI